MARGEAWITNYLPKLIGEGLSPTAALRLLRAPEAEGGFGLSIRTQTWYQAWGETVAALASREAIAQAPLGRRPVADEITPFSSRTATGFLYSVDVLVRNRATGETYYTPSGFRSQQRVSYRTAIAGAVSAIADAAIAGSPSAGNLQVLGALPVEVREYQPGQA